MSLLTSADQEKRSPLSRGQIRTGKLWYEVVLVPTQNCPPRHCVNANQVFSWRRLFQQGRLGVPALMRDDGLLPVVLAPTAPAPGNASADGDNPGTIVLELGQVRVGIDGHAARKPFLALAQQGRRRAVVRMPSPPLGERTDPTPQPSNTIALAPRHK